MSGGKKYSGEHVRGILNSPIPHGGFGRAITSSEARSLRALGYRVRRGTIVVRCYSERDDQGHIYSPVSGERCYSNNSYTVE